MGKVTCPFCNSRNTFNISYGYLKEKKIKKNYVELDTNINYRKGFEKHDFDGEKLISHLPNHYCKDCGKRFQSRKVMYTVDISVINLIIYVNDDYYRYIFDFSDKENTNYTLKINWIPIKINEPITINDMNKILSSFKKYKPNLWNSHYGDPYSYTKYYWILKCTYYNGIDYVKSGNDKVPNNWHDFIKPFKIIFNENIFDLES